MSMRIELDEDRGFFPMETLAGHVGWELSGEVQARELELRLFWYTEGKGDQDVDVVETKAIPLSGPKGEEEFSFRLPHRPYSFSGKLISLIWALELVDEASGEAERKTFILSPSGREILLEMTEPESEA